MEIKLKILMDKESIFNDSITQMRAIQLQMATYQNQIKQLDFHLRESERSYAELSESYSRLFQEYSNLINYKMLNYPGDEVSHINVAIRSVNN